RLVAERFELLESFIERHGRDSPKRVSGRPRPGCRTTRRTSRRVPRASTAAARESRTAANTPQSTEINRTAHPPYPFGSEPDLRKGERVSGRGRKVDVSRQSKRRGGVCSDPHRGLVHSTWGGGHAGTEAGNAALVGTGFCSDVYDWGEGLALNLFHGRVAPDRAARNFAVSRVVHAAVVPSPAVYDLIYGCQAGVPGVSPPEQPGVDEGGGRWRSRDCASRLAADRVDLLLQLRRVGLGGAERFRLDGLLARVADVLHPRGRA